MHPARSLTLDGSTSRGGRVSGSRQILRVCLRAYQIDRTDRPTYRHDTTWTGRWFRPPLPRIRPKPPFC